MTPTSQWVPGHSAWTIFTEHHPELGLRAGPWQLHNFLRIHRDALVSCDAIRKARGRHWIAHVDRFVAAAFDCATGFSCGKVA